MRALLALGSIALGLGRRTYIYVDEWTMQSESNLVTYYTNLVKAGATDIMNSFMVPNCPCGAADEADSVGDWVRMSAASRQQILDLVHSSKGMFHLVCGGGTYGTEYLNYTPENFSDYVCGHAKTYGYDGVDFDLENLSAGFGVGAAMTWAIEATKHCRNYVSHITHAPQSPYLGTWGSFGYEALLPYVDKLLIQYYNQGAAAAHDTYNAIFISDIHQASISEIWARNPSHKEKLVVGKYMYSNHGGSGMMSSEQIVAAMEKAESELGYDGGIMIWKYPNYSDSALQTFLHTDLPRLAAGGNSGTIQETTTTTTPSPGNVINPDTSSTTTTTTTTTRPSVSGGNAVSVCKGTIGNPSNIVWHEDCHNLCEVYAGLLSGHCPHGVSDGNALALCVMAQHPFQCYAV